MTDFFWDIFKKSGNIDAFMAYKEFMDYKKANENNDDIKVNSHEYI